MEPALYTLIGAFGGIAITQLANYFLEDKKTKNQISLKKIEFHHLEHKEFRNEKKAAYSRYLEATDCFVPGDLDRLNSLVAAFYGAAIVAEPDTVEMIREVFELTKSKWNAVDFDNAFFMNTKGKLFRTMQNELK